ncbi:TetR/AcrR family transcriptional regulator [Pseudomonas chlororaphis]|uniref:TetR family transcriptional regulator n=1 Tax=Pseudomonas chlororaphis TaxID=587753 RepID=A0A1Q8EQ67_9PSED|nr:TetR/AcrR family transcriptional regulator [Pseudomonas chlororaphis]OLF53934.1 TetR family transcriptional regulator [Pseudomonas chlororaphis]
MDSLELLERCYPGRRAELKRVILQQALACFNEQGIEATTIEMIRAACDTSVGAIYHHFGNKEGLVAALFFAALDDQAGLRERYLAAAATLEQGVRALVHSYVDWVDAQPEWARFQFQARYALAKGPFGEELASRNKARNRLLREWLARHIQGEAWQQVPVELLPSLIVGQAESYCRSWLSGRVRSRPATYREQLANAAWHSICASQG